MRVARGAALGLSAGLHALAVLAALAATRPALPPAPEETVSLIWAGHGEGAAETGGGETGGALAAAEAPGPAQPAAIPVPPEAQAPEQAVVPEPPAPPMAEPVPEAEFLPLPPPPAPARPAPRPAARAAAGAVAGAAAPAQPPAALPPAGPAPAEGGVVPPQPLGGLHNPAPAYPAMSRRSGEQGRVTLRVSVDEEGRVLGIEVARSSGHLALDLAATRAVRDWRFRPAMREGQPVLATAEVGITFRLQGDQAW